MAQTTGFEDLVWGHGPCVLDIFLEPTCPHSGRAFAKLKPLLAKVGEEQLTVRIVIQSQPWLIFSSVVSRAVLAASGTEGGCEAAYKVMQVVFDNREEFVCEEHCRGANFEVSPAEMLRRIEGYSGIELKAVFEQKAVTNLLKRHTRIGRQNGIHRSPTFLIDGLVNDKLSSGDEIDDWIRMIGMTV